MSTATHPSHESSRRHGSHAMHHGSRAHWSAGNIAGMVLGFVFFWPIGLAILAWIFSGRHVRDLPAAGRQLWSSVTGKSSSLTGFGAAAATDNVVFNDYQDAQYERIREIKAELGARAQRFAEFRENARRRADKDEFDRFMADAPNRSAE